VVGAGGYPPPTPGERGGARRLRHSPKWVDTSCTAWAPATGAAPPGLLSVFARSRSISSSRMAGPFTSATYLGDGAAEQADA